MRRIATTLIVLFCWTATSATAQPTSCDTSFTFTNIYGVADLFRFILRDSSNHVIWHQDEFFFPSNDTSTISLLSDDDGDSPQFIPGEIYTLSLDLSGFGVCCGAFSNFTIALSDDFAFTDGTATKQGFYPPGSLTSQLFQFRRSTNGSSCPVLLDPIESLLGFPQSADISTDPAILGARGRPVVGIAADGVARVVIRIPVPALGDNVSLRVMHGRLTESTDVAADGGLDFVPGSNFRSSLPGQLQVTEPTPGSGRFMAFAVYRAPRDFIEGDAPCFTPDCGSALRARTVYIEMTRNGSSFNFPVTIVRPPVVLVHGLNADRGAWDTFQPFISDQRFDISRSNYGGPVSGVTDIVPDYRMPDSAGTGQPDSVLKYWPVLGSYLGFEFNAATVNDDIRDAIDRFRTGARVLNGAPVAAAQADVVAHSMGGVVGTIPHLDLWNFSSWSNYWQGTVHKMITLGTPHLGSPNGRQVLEAKNSCVAGIMAATSLPMFLKFAFVQGKLVDGGSFDLAGDGTTGGALSLALRTLQTPAAVALPVATIAGKATTAQYDGLDHSPLALALPVVCAGQDISNDPDSMVGNYTGGRWPVMMGAHADGSDTPSHSDGVVPLASALNGRVSIDVESDAANGNTVPAVHSIGLIMQGFPHPHLQEEWNTVLRVINLLNTPVTNPVFGIVP